MPDVFLSYSHDDRAAVELYVPALEAEGLSVWWDNAVHSGEAFDEKIEQALREAKAVVVLWSKRSVASRWVRAEATLADRKRSLVPVMIEACERPIIFELTQTVDLTHWRGDAGDGAWKTLMAEVRRLVNAAPASAPRTAPPAPAPSLAANRRSGRTSIAIMPFVNRSGERDDDVFADGMVEDLISALSLARTGRVIASSATRAFRNNATDLRLIGRELGARYILEGNVRRVGPDLRVTAQLAEAETGAILWTAKFDRPLAELAYLQEELVTEVAGQIGVQIGRLELERVLRKPGDVTAWEAMMRSFAAYGRLGTATAGVAVAEARRAVDLAPDYAVAHGCLALALSTQFVIYVRTDKAVGREAYAYAERALELGPDDFNVLWTTAWAWSNLGEDDQAVACGTRAVEICPNNANARNALAQALLWSARPEDAIEQMDEADRLAPRGFSYFLSLANRALALWQMGQFELGLEAIDRSLALNPNYQGAMNPKIILLAKLGRDEEARRLMVRSRRTHPDFSREMLVAGVSIGGFGRTWEDASAQFFRTWDATLDEPAAS